MEFDDVDPPIVEGVLPEAVDQLAVPVELNALLPWHRARKQFVRENQWLRFSRELIEREEERPGFFQPTSSSRDVRYLTLPGIDYLDVRQLAQVCRDLGCSLTSTGFQSGAESNPYVARAQLREKSLIDEGHITHRSNTFAGQLQDIVHTTSPVYRDLKSRGPFHIINVDACGSVASPTADHERRLIDALYRIVEMQVELMSAPWLLFVTADARPDSIAGPTLQKLCDPIFANADESDEFHEGAVDLLDPDREDVRRAVSAASTTAGTPFLHLVSLGLAKWFLHLVRGKTWEMKTHMPYCYSTMPEGDDTPSMVCLAFEFLPPPPGLEDPFGVARAKPAKRTVPEDTSLRAIRMVRMMMNADVRMQADQPLRERMIQNLYNLLKEAGYAPAALDALGA